MKKIVLLVIISLSIAMGQTQAQSLGSIFPQYKEYLGSYYSTYTSGSLYYNYDYQKLKFKVNQSITFDLSSSAFWNGCTNFKWHLNLPSGASTVYGKNQVVTPTNAGHGMISIDAIDKDGVRHRNCSIMIEVIN